MRQLKLVKEIFVGEINLMLAIATDIQSMNMEDEDIIINLNKSEFYPLPAALVCVLYYQGLRP
jgi:hypothetical protein